MLQLELGTLVTYNPLSVEPAANVCDVLATMQKFHIRHMPVVDHARTLLGMFSDADVARAITQSRGATAEILNASVRDLMAAHTVTIATDTTPHAALSLLLQHGFHALPVVTDGRLIGMLTSTDFLREFADRTLVDWDTSVEECLEPCALRVEADSPLDAAIAALQEHHSQHLLVLQGDTLLGVVTERQLSSVLREALFNAAHDHEELAWDAACLRDLLPATFVHLEPEQSLRSAARKMVEGGLEALPVIDDHGRLLGVLADTDIMAALLNQLTD